LTLVVLLSGVPCVSAQTKTVDKTVSLASAGTVILEAHNGSIDIRTWDRPEVQVHVQIDAASSSASDVRRFDETTVDVAATRDVVRISTVSPDMTSFSGWFGSSPTIRYTVTAPADARWNVSAHNARTEVRDVGAPLRVETHNGTLRVYNLNGPLDVIAHNGETMVDFRTFRGATIAVHNGTTDLTLPRASRFDLRTSSHNGALASDFQMMTTASVRRGNDVDATVNGGGSPLRFESHNGSLRLRAK
jgi:DUF4097 and DUF4098 domain-containing protein YvlB